MKNLAILAFLIVTLAACGGKEKDNSPEMMIAGEDSKTWVAKREYDASGEKDKITRDEKDEQIVFYRNGKFNMSSDSNTESGTWQYNAGNRELQLVFTGAGVSENFDVSEISKNRMTLMGGDGSKMILKTD